MWKNKPPGDGHKALQTHKKIAQCPLRAIEWIGDEKNRHIHTKALQGSIIDHFRVRVRVNTLYKSTGQPSYILVFRDPSALIYTCR